MNIHEAELNKTKNDALIIDTSVFGACGTGKQYYSALSPRLIPMCEILKMR